MYFQPLFRDVFTGMSFLLSEHNQLTFLSSSVAAPSISCHFSSSIWWTISCFCSSASHSSVDVGPAPAGESISRMGSIRGRRRDDEGSEEEEA